jgi:predicted nucleic acid-binding protein
MAIKTPSGLPGRIAHYCLEKNLYQIIMTKQIAVEACRKLKQKIDLQAVQAFNYTITRKGIVHQIIEDDDIEKWHGVISDTDAHVLAGAKEGHADVLVTVDSDFLTQPVNDHFPIPIFKPFAFLEWLDSKRKEL